MLASHTHVFPLLLQRVVIGTEQDLLNNTWPTNILMVFLSFSDNLLQDSHIMGEKRKDVIHVILRYHTEHAQFQFWVQFPHQSGNMQFSEMNRKPCIESVS